MESNFTFVLPVLYVCTLRMGVKFVLILPVRTENAIRPLIMWHLRILVYLFLRCVSGAGNVNRELQCR